MANTRSSSYDSDGKCLFLRPTWARESTKLARELNRPLDAVWLSDNKFTDLQPIYPLFREVLVAENKQSALLEKQEFLSQAPADFAAVVKIPTRPKNMLQLVEDLIADGRKRDVANLDFCAYLDSHVIETLSTCLRGRVLRPRGLLFMTVARSTQACMKPKLEHERLASTLEAVDQQIAAEFSKDGATVEALPGFPYLYDGRNSKMCRMFSFGWRIRSYARGKHLTGFAHELSAREKRAIVYLRSAGFASTVISGAFHVSPGTIAALLAHYTRSARKVAVAIQELSSVRGSEGVDGREPAGLRKVDVLSDREKKAITCLRFAGLPNEAIAAAFAIRPGTVSALLAHFTRNADRLRTERSAA